MEKENITKEIDSSLLYYIQKELVVTIPFTSDTNTIVSNRQINTIVNWCKKVKNDPKLRSSTKESVEETYVIQLKGIVTPQTSYTTTKRRMNNIQYYIDNTLGIHLKGDVPVFDILYSFDYRDKVENSVLICVNKVHY